MRKIITEVKVKTFLGGVRYIKLDGESDWTGYQRSSGCNIGIPLTNKVSPKSMKSLISFFKHKNYETTITYREEH